MRDTAATTACPNMTTSEKTLSNCPNQVEYNMHRDTPKQFRSVIMSTAVLGRCAIWQGTLVSILCTSNMLQTGQATPSSLTHVKQAWRPQTDQRMISDPIREEESKRRHLLHRKLHGHAHESNRLKISEALAEWMRVADCPWQSWDDVLRRVETASSATPGVARTCTREQPIEDIGSTGRVHESSRLPMAKLNLNGVSHVYQTRQADVKTCHLKAKNAS